MADWSTRAEGALRAFEEISGLHVSLHDLSQRWAQLLPVERFQHQHPACAAAKAVRTPACKAFDADRVRAECRRRPDGFAKVCHAGVLDLVVPWLEDGRLRWVLFAGALRPLPGAAHIHDDNPLPRGGPWAPALARCDTADARRAGVLLEGLRQLAARLAAIAAEAEAAGLGAGEVNRAESVRRFISAHHAKDLGLPDLARHLGLSPSRTGHAVREWCGQGFLELLTEARLRAAAGLLRHTGLALPEIARRCGFANQSNFHRRFRRRFACTPHRYRRQAEG